mmetsp:Transcript_31243/g.56719  ORF Transcript_31243/g.56719 Transcript_31243/m.56719 type:complete len:1082 (-) Transcript_31243:103-3348(-)|eukprot:CAMPEP_0175051036 /NCGR_PEP_ID=MMETSP0052_2-20121109/7573_1 /TAXON_ID=51329 ORGANISM="Polytomella parva, Strain SAG 63-3" /NCGR_SAMPLE_ID=MMETSP0052_2 /ASSEMBLY_ACC=CAM_ASM_000194 /LENGTH=1081 /DNA_ID=CAMNT_0016315269 /DNA_START=347 /DNA_END=3592 /DNA_ORIENTATION=+
MSQSRGYGNQGQGSGGPYKNYNENPFEARGPRPQSGREGRGDYHEGGRRRGGYDGGRGGRSRGPSQPSGIPVSSQDADQKYNNLVEILNRNLGGGAKLSNDRAGRPAPGNLGKEIRVQTNHLFVELNPKAPLIRLYDVVICKLNAEELKTYVERNGEEKKPFLEATKCDAFLRLLFEKKRWNFNSCAYDGRALLYVAGSVGLPDALSEELSITHPNKTVEKAWVYLRYATSENLSKNLTDFSSGVSNEAILKSFQAINLAIRMAPSSNPNLFRHKNGFYSRDGQLISNPNSLVQRTAHQGFTQTIQAAEKNLNLVVDVSCVAITKPEPVVNTICRLTRMDERTLASSGVLSSKDIKKLNAIAENSALRFKISHRTQGRCTFALKKFTDLPANKITFQVPDRRSSDISDIASSMDAMSVANTPRANDRSGPKRLISVSEYFREVYNITLRYPHLPCLVAKKGDLFPVEFCSILPSGSSGGGLTADETTSILRLCALKPAERFSNINAMVRERDYGRDPVLNAFGLHVRDREFLRVPARILEQPYLQYGNGVIVDPGNSGSWNLINIKMYDPASIRSMAILSLSDSSMSRGGRGSSSLPLNTVFEFFTEFRKIATSAGLRFELRRDPPMIESSYSGIGPALAQAKRKAQECYGPTDMPLILVILNGKDGLHKYKQVKYYCEGELGIISQCVRAEKMGMSFSGLDRAGLPSKLAGVAQKVNSKLGGENVRLYNDFNWCPVLRNRKVMIMGADVTHPTGVTPQRQKDYEDELALYKESLKEMKKEEEEYANSCDSDGNTTNRFVTSKYPDRPKDLPPSIAAVTASINLACSRYIARVVAQTACTERISTMEKEVVGILLAWYRVNKALPESIIMFRDGVSEGEIERVEALECNAIERACEEISSQLGSTKKSKGTTGVTYKPNITFVTVQKRHATRIGPVPGDYDNAKNNNVMPGTVIDTEIVPRHQFIYQLNSHAGLQGSNKAPKYCVLRNDDNFSSNEMQLLTYWLCFMFNKCTKSVSYPAPTYYAHHAASHGRYRILKEATYNEDDFSDNVSEISSTSGTSGQSDLAMVPMLDHMIDTMYFV